MKFREFEIVFLLFHPESVSGAEVQSLKDPKVLQDWLHKQVVAHGVKVTNLTTSWSNGMALCALIYHYHPELM